MPIAMRLCVKCHDYADAFEHGYSATRRFLLARGAAMDEAEEIAQAAWVRGWECRTQLRDPSLVFFWVNSIARNLYRARFRSAPVCPIDDFDTAYYMTLDQLEVRLLLERCTDRDRALLEKSLEGFSAEEIAEGTGVTSTGIRVRLLRIRQALKEQLALVA